MIQETIKGPGWDIDLWQGGYWTAYIHDSHHGFWVDAFGAVQDYVADDCKFTTQEAAEHALALHLLGAREEQS